MAGGGVMQTLSQKRAAKALELLLDIGNRTKNDEKQRKDFQQMSKSIPPMILQNGLGQTIAFLKAKGEDKHNRMYDVLNLWLKSLGLIQADILRELNEMSSNNYLIIQTESLRFLEWVKRYANAEIFE